MCPCSAKTLVRNVMDPLKGLANDIEEMRAKVRETLEAMIAHGDLLESFDIEEDVLSDVPVLLYAAPASFFARESGTAILLGISSAELLGNLADRIEYSNHVRRLHPIAGEDLSADLQQLGFIEIPYNFWSRLPQKMTSAQHLDYMNGLLDASGPSGDVPGLSVLDWDRPVQYYRGRWISPSSRSGRYVARRSQAYGADLWCYVELRVGKPTSLVDLPLADSNWRGCDEAWRLQMAIDAHRGNAQQFRVRREIGNRYMLQFFSPLPMWARRRFDSVGQPVSSAGCLFAYRLAEAELAEEVRFATDELWLAELKDTPESR